MYYYLHTYTAKCYYSHKKLELITMYVKLCNMIFFFGKKEIIEWSNQIFVKVPMRTP